MKRRIKPSKPTISKRPNDQKLIETFVLLNQAKKENENKINNNINNNKLPLDVNNFNKKEVEKNQEITQEEMKKAEIDFIQRQNELKLINRGIFFEQDNQKLIEEVKKTNPELYKKVTKEEEMIFPIMIDTNVGVYKELLSSKIEEILTKINNNSKWVEVIPIIDVSIVKIKIKDPENENNFIIIGFITKAISYKLYLLSLNKIISIKIFVNKNGRRLAIFIGLNYNKYSIQVDFSDEKKIMYKLHFKSDLVLGNDIYKILKELKEKYTPLETYKKDFINLLSDNSKEKDNSSKLNDFSNNKDEENSSENSEEKKKI